jgi:serine/threonine-protein kinase
MTDATDRLAASLADRYRVERELGQGGMATVYLAQDLKHDRRVAIKVLRPELAAVIGAERFLREIKTIANLQHPHILGLIDSGEVNGTAYYVMPFVEGESLRDRLNREKQLPIADAVRLASEVAAALDYAHRHGVIHRDIKPENVMLHDGSALVADFGIALAVTSAGGSRMTETGMSLGTPHYMSPEQAMGEREITARSDVYALGAMTFEMLIGEPPFGGPTAQAIVAKVLTEAPPSLTLRRPSIPDEVEATVVTALEKLPADRFGSAAEFSLALQGGNRDLRKTTGRHTRATRSVFPKGLLVLGMLALAAAAFYLGRRSGALRAAPLTFGSSLKVTWDPTVEALPSISPDGKSVAYSNGTTARMRIFVRSVSGGRGLALTDDTTQVQSHPQWSPDGSRILFLQGGGVFSVSAAGGAETPEVRPGRSARIATATWSPDGSSIAYAYGDSLFVRDGKGEVRSLASFFEPNECQWSPDGEYIACASGNAISMVVGTLFGNQSPSKIVTVRLADGAVTALTDSNVVNQSPVWSPDSRWLYFVSNAHGPRDLYSVRLSGGKAKGKAIRVTTGLNAHTMSLSRDGRRLAFATLEIESNAWTIPVPRSAQSATDATQLTFGRQLVETADISPDGRWVIYDSDVGGNSDIYRMLLPNGTPERLTTDSSDDFFPSISPDGREVAFHSWRGGTRDIYVLSLDGGPVQRISSSPRQEAIAAWSPDGTRLAFCDFTGNGGIWVAQRVGGAWQAPVLRLSHGFWPRWSPDGKLLSFSTGLTRGSIWIMPADSGPARLVADSTGPRAVVSDQPLWSPDGRSIMTRSTDANGNATFSLVPLDGSPPRLLLTFDGRGPKPSRGGWRLRANQMVYTAPAQQSDIWVMEVEEP